MVEKMCGIVFFLWGILFSVLYGWDFIRLSRLSEVLFQGPNGWVEVQVLVNGALIGLVLAVMMIIVGLIILNPTVESKYPSFNFIFAAFMSLIFWSLVMVLKHQLPLNTLINQLFCVGILILRGVENLRNKKAPLL